MIIIIRSVTMARNARKISESGIYHVMLRGINRQNIFEEHADFEKIIYLLKSCKKQCGYELYAWCLMPNHIHILMKEGKEPLGRVFKRIGAAFVYWYNLKYERVGHLFQDRFKSEPVESEDYFLTVVRYIHLNPVKAGICRLPGEYQYSSYPRYFSDPDLIDSAPILEMMSEKEFRQFHLEKNEDICMDQNENSVRHLTDEQVISILTNEFNMKQITRLKSLSKDLRNNIIQRLLQSGASIRQLSRLSGISIKTIRMTRDEGKGKGTGDGSVCPR